MGLGLCPLLGMVSAPNLPSTLHHVTPGLGLCKLDFPLSAGFCPQGPLERPEDRQWGRNVLWWLVLPGLPPGRAHVSAAEVVPALSSLGHIENPPCCDSSRYQPGSGPSLEVWASQRLSWTSEVQRHQLQLGYTWLPGPSLTLTPSGLWDPILLLCPTILAVDSAFKKLSSVLPQCFLSAPLEPSKTPHYMQFPMLNSLHEVPCVDSAFLTP